MSALLTLFDENPLTQVIRSLFASGEQGIWLDPSDFSTLFQDSAGTTPVTALGQPVGKILDKSGRGNHATQSTAASRPTVEARVNRCTKSEFPGGTADSGVKAGLIAGVSLPNWLGRFTTGISFGHDGSTGSYVYMGSALASAQHTISVFVKMDDGGAPSFGSATFSNVANDFVLVVSGLSVSPLTYSVTSVGDGVYRVSFTATAGTTNLFNNGVIKYGSNSSRTFKVTGYQLELGATATTYQRVNTATDYADVGAPRYNALDKTDDQLLVAAGGAGTTGFLLVAGIMVPAAGTARTLWSDRGTNAGYKVGIDASNQIVFSAGNGTAFVTATGPALVAGTKYVITAWHDGANLNISVNNGAPTQAAFVTATAGTATFTIGKSNGAATEYWGDRIYGMIYRNNDTSNTSQRNQAYSYMVGKMGGL